MKKMLRFTCLVGVLALAVLAMPELSYATEDCSTLWGSACTMGQQPTYCDLDDAGCRYFYSCWCDHSGSGKWVCGPSPVHSSCPAP